MNGCESAIPEFYRGRQILITGATGFMGKVLVEKLLRSCPDIETIYLLMRPKRGNDVRLRLQELLNATVRTHTGLSQHLMFRLYKICDGKLSTGGISA